MARAKTQKGAIVSLDLFNPLSSITVFQYNPSTMTRALEPADSSKPQALAGAPTEKISLQVEINATDQLAVGDKITKNVGIYPQLSALEMLLYPKATKIIADSVALKLGKLEIVPGVSQLTLFIWGLKRVLPIKVESFSASEEMYDAGLNPISAKVDLTLQVLNYNDLTIKNPGFWIFAAHQLSKEGMSSMSSAVNGIAKFGDISKFYI